MSWSRQLVSRLVDLGRSVFFFVLRRSAAELCATACFCSFFSCCCFLPTPVLVECIIVSRFWLYRLDRVAIWQMPVLPTGQSTQRHAHITILPRLNMLFAARGEEARHVPTQSSSQSTIVVLWGKCHGRMSFSRVRLPEYFESGFHLPSVLRCLRLARDVAGTHLNCSCPR